MAYVRRVLLDGGAAGLFAGCKFDAVGLEFLSSSGQVVRSGFQGAKGGTFSGCWSMGLELLSEKRSVGRGRHEPV